MLFTNFHSYQIYDGNNLPGAETYTWLKTQLGRNGASWNAGQWAITGSNNRLRQSDANCIHCHFRMFAPLFYFVSTEAEKSWGIKWIYVFAIRMPFHFLFWLFCSSRTNAYFLKLLLPYLDSTAWKPKLLVHFWEEHTIVKLCLGDLPSLMRKHQTGLCFEAVTQLQSQIWT